MVDTKYKKALYNEGAQQNNVKSRLICRSRVLNTTSAVGLDKQISSDFNRCALALQGASPSPVHTTGGR